MFCKYCGNQLFEEATVCPRCGQATREISSADSGSVPPQNRPLSAWAYFGLQLLFAIPVIGFIFLIVFSFNNSNINRRNFARSYWCVFLLAAIIVGIMVALGVASGSYYYYY